MGLFIMISGRRMLDSQHGIIFSAAREIGKCEIAPSSLAFCPKGALFISGGRKGRKGDVSKDRERSMSLEQLFFLIVNIRVKYLDHFCSCVYHIK